MRNASTEPYTFVLCIQRKTSSLIKPPFLPRVRVDYTINVVIINIHSRESN